MGPTMKPTLHSVAREFPGNRPRFPHPGLGARDERQFQRGRVPEAAEAGDYGELHIKGSAPAVRRPDWLATTAGRSAKVAAARRRKRRCTWRSRARGMPAPCFTPIRSGAPCCRRDYGAKAGLAADRIRDAERARRRAHPPAQRVGADSRERSGHAGARPPRGSRCCEKCRRSMASCCAATGCTLGATTWPRRDVTSRFSSSCSKPRTDAARLSHAGEAHGPDKNS